MLLCLYSRDLELIKIYIFFLSCHVPIFRFNRQRNTVFIIKPKTCYRCKNCDYAVIMKRFISKLSGVGGGGERNEEGSNFNWRL